MPIKHIVNSVSMDDSSWAIAHRLGVLRNVSRSKAISLILHEKAWNSQDKELRRLSKIIVNELKPRED